MQQRKFGDLRIWSLNNITLLREGCLLQNAQPKVETPHTTHVSNLYCKRRRVYEQDLEMACILTPGKHVTEI